MRNKSALIGVIPFALGSIYASGPLHAEEKLSWGICQVITTSNEEACCAAENRDAVEEFLTEDGRQLCALSPSDRSALLKAPSNTSVRPVPGSPPTNQPPGGILPPVENQPPGTPLPPLQPPVNGGSAGVTGNPGNEPGINGPDREVGKAGEDPRSEGFHSTPSGEAYGRSGTNDGETTNSSGSGGGDGSSSTSGSSGSAGGSGGKS